MIGSYREVKRYFGAIFGITENIPNGIYAIPVTTSRGRAFMKMEVKENKPFGEDNFKLFWDEKLTISWYDSKRPLFLRESKLSRCYRKLQVQLL